VELGRPAGGRLFFAQTGEISINRGAALKGRAAVAEMVAGLHTEFSDLELRCDLMRKAGTRAVFVWTLEGHHAQTQNHVRVSGWEEWELDDELQVLSSERWFDAEDYQRQIDAT